MQRAPLYEAAIKKREDAILCRVNIQNWKSAVAQQYNIRSIPYLIVYDPDGKKIESGNDVKFLRPKAPAHNREDREAREQDGLVEYDDYQDAGTIGPLTFALFAGGALFSVAAVLFILTKLFGPQRRGP